MTAPPPSSLLQATAGRSMSLALHDLKDMVRPEFRASVRDPDISAPIRDWLARAVVRIAQDPALRNLRDQGVVAQGGALAQIQILLCHPEDAIEIFEASEDTLGLHLVANPDCDPFGDEAPCARAYRILIPWDQDRLNRLVQEDWDLNGFLDPGEAALSWASTIGHEIGHVLLFAENGNFNSPQDLDLLEDEIGHDLFDFSTGYGIRPLLVDGLLEEAQDAEHAHLLMERHVEEVGRAICERRMSDMVGELVDLLRDAHGMRLCP